MTQAASVTTWHLEMLAPEQLVSARAPEPPPLVMRAELPCPELNRFLYQTVGAAWSWTDRLPWTIEQWRAYVDRPELETWVAYLSGTPAGYVELETQDSGASVEIAYFGLLPAFVGRGLGGHLLTVATQRAWQLGARRRVWVHTCSLDAPHALTNYQKRGFRVFKTEATPGPPP